MPIDPRHTPRAQSTQGEMRPPSNLAPWLVGLLFLSTVLVYLPGVGGGFILDDVNNILNDSFLAIDHLSFAALYRAAMSGHSGVLGRPLSMLTFALNFYACGPSPFYFKLTNVFIHAINVVAIYFLSRALLEASTATACNNVCVARPQILAALAAAAWGLHPLALTSVLYVVQRMTSLAAFFTILSLILFVHGRLRLLKGARGAGYVVASLFLILPAFLTKETGALIPVFMFIMEFTIFRFRTHRQAERVFLYSLYIVTLLLPVVIGIWYLFTHPQWLLGGYAHRDFTLTERLLTECRALWFYLSLILLPQTTRFGLFHDDFGISQTLLAPPSTLFSVVGLIGLLAAALALRRRAPILSFGILFFLGGHLLESSVIPLELIYEHRNYLPMFGIIFAVIYYSTYLSSITTRKISEFVFAALLVVVFALTTTVRANEWRNPLTHAIAATTHHPQSARANYFAGRIYEQLAVEQPANELYYDRARHYFGVSTRVNPTFTAGLFGLTVLNAITNRVTDPDTISTLTFRLRRFPTSSTSTSWITFLVACRGRGKCPVAAGEIENILASTLSNNTCQGHNRAEILTAAASYYFSQLHNTPKGLDFARQAVQTEPRQIQYMLNLAGFQITAGRLTEAERTVDKAASLDSKGLYTAQINTLKRVIAANN